MKKRLLMVVIGTALITSFLLGQASAGGGAGNWTPVTIKTPDGNLCDSMVRYNPAPSVRYICDEFGHV